MITLRNYIKKQFPTGYTMVRSVLFPLVFSLRQRKSTQFTTPQQKEVSVLGKTYKVHIDPKNGFIDTQIFTTGGYELDILAVMQNHLKPGDTFVDIGGNIGWHTLFGAATVGSTGHVYTFEPIKRLCSQIETSLTYNNFNKYVTVFPFGCSTEDKEVPLHINQKNIGGSSIFNPSNSTTAVETITLRRGDEALANIDSRIALIKIDTEGSELEALSGLTETLAKDRPTLIIEYSPSFWGTNAKEKSKQFFSILTQNKYTIYDLEHGHQQIEPNEAWILNFKKLQTNFLCVYQPK